MDAGVGNVEKINHSGKRAIPGMDANVKNVEQLVSLVIIGINANAAFVEKSGTKNTTGIKKLSNALFVENKQTFM